MRQFLLAVMLMGAAFAGGAVVNGPGLRWVREHVLNQSGEEGDAAVPEGAALAVEASIPAAPVPALGSNVPAPDKAKSVGKTAAKSDPAPASQPAAAAVAENAPKSADPPPPLAPPADASGSDAARKPPTALALAESPAPVSMLPPLESPVDAEATPPGAPDPGQGGELVAPRTPDPAASPRPQADATGTAAWADAPDSAPAAAVPPKGYQKPGEATDTAVAPAATTGGDWAALRRRMAALGVSRYGFEGEPNGRVRFHCVIPLAGRRAVGQQFEAEADDEFQAAQIALRRVALWQATESP